METSEACQEKNVEKLALSGDTRCIMTCDVYRTATQLA